MIGDILFYRNPSWSDIPDDLIALYEGNKNDFIHCAIQVSSKEKVEALWSKISITGINDKLISGRYSPKVRDMMPGWDWLNKQVGQPYGAGDILDVLLRHPIFECHYDCSALAAQYLKIVDDPIMDAFSDFSVHMITPQELAVALGVK